MLQIIYLSNKLHRLDYSQCFFEEPTLCAQQILVSNDIA